MDTNEKVVRHLRGRSCYIFQEGVDFGGVTVDIDEF
jgi:hypothetical protein